MDPLVQAIVKAWERVRPIVEKNPDELARRLARRRLNMMQRPPRAWCLAVRASDRRINPATAACVPEEGAYPKSHLPKDVPPNYGPHDVTLTAALLRKLSRPYYVPSPGISTRELAEKLGTSSARIRRVALRGHLTIEYYRGFNGRPGQRIPRVFTRKPLDSCAGRSLQADDPLWGITSEWLENHVPGDLEQTVRRLPYFRVMGHPRWHGRMVNVFKGWMWICPGCGKRVRILYHPLPRVYAFKLLDREAPPGEVDGMPEPPRWFACMECHRVMYFSRVSKASWGQLIAHLTGGMLYGSEVPRKELIELRRKWAYRPRIGRAPSKTRAEVLQRVLKGWDNKAIAKDLGITRQSVKNRLKELYEQNRVHSREDLIGAFGVEVPARTGRECRLPLALRRGAGRGEGSAHSR